jgi:autoinducer 2-degrading protein
MSKVTPKGYIMVPDADLAAVMDELPVHVNMTRKEEGCLVFEVTGDETENHKFHVYEEFVDEAAFARHQQRVRSSKWGSVTKNVERFYEITGLDN